MAMDGLRQWQSACDDVTWLLVAGTLDTHASTTTTVSCRPGSECMYCTFRGSIAETGTIASSYKLKNILKI